MAVRAYWKGHLKLALVSCPVALYPASSSTARTHFHQINREQATGCGSALSTSRPAMKSKAIRKLRGFEVSKGRYLEIEQDELDAIKLESTHVIDIDSFVPADDIDQRYLDKPYYIAPDGKSGAEAFVVIRNAMEAKDRIALARIVLTSREHVMALRPCGKGLLGTTLRYPERSRATPTITSATFRSPRVSRDMIDLAAHILETKAAKFDPSKFQGPLRHGAQGAGQEEGVRQSDQAGGAGRQGRQCYRPDGCVEAQPRRQGVQGTGSQVQKQKKAPKRAAG